MTNENNSAPLAGIRMLDLGRYQAGPRCALMFARMGAEVIKVEALTGDESRENGPRVRGQSAYWVQYNSGKKSLAIDLRTEKGKEVLTRLVKKSDISRSLCKLMFVLIPSITVSFSACIIFFIATFLL